MTLQDTVANQELASLDLSKVAALQQKRTLAFVNHFVLTTIQFLNNFMKNCEQKLMQFERKLEKVEAAMVLLEARLSSIPEVNTEPDPKPVEKLPEAASNNTQDTTKEIEDPVETNTQTVPVDQPPDSAEPEVHPEYERFVKMVQVGVPLEAVKLKVSVEGLDPSILAKLLGK